MTRKKLLEISHENRVSAKKMMTISIEGLQSFAGLFADFNPKKMTTREVQERFKIVVQALNTLADGQKLLLPFLENLIAGSAAELANEP